MAMAVDSRQQSQFNMGYDPMRYQPSPHFTNPWVSAPATTQGHMYATAMPATSVAADSHRYAAPTSNVSAAYTGAPLPAPSMATGIASMDADLYERHGLQTSQDPSRSYGMGYTSAPAPSASAYAPIAAPQYSSAPYGYQADRRPSHPLVHLSACPARVPPTSMH